MVCVSMMQSVADCFVIRAVARQLAGLVAGVGLSGITGQLTRLSANIHGVIMKWLIMGWVTTSGMVSILRRGFTAVGCLDTLTAFFKCCIGIDNGTGTAKAGPAGCGWYVLISVGLPLLAPEAAFWSLGQGRV